MNFAEKIKLTCEEQRELLLHEILLNELDGGQDLTPDYGGFYCTITDFHIDHTTQVDCDVYPSQRNNIKVVRFSASRVLHLPYSIFRFFPNIREFDIASSEVEVLQRFEDAKNLVFLIMSNNNLTELGASLFVNTQMLTVVDFSHNKISKINKYAFAEAQSLSRIVLSYNDITELDKRLFKDLRFLDQIFLDNNRIKVIPPELFSCNAVLQNIVLSNNRISTFSSNYLTGLKYLEILHLAGNFLTEFDPTFLETKLYSLNLSNNNLTSLIIRKMISIEAANNSITSVISLDDSSILTTLIIANNSLSSITNITSQFTNLEVLDLSFNRVSKLNITTFSKLTKLIKLDLEKTDISNIDFGTFANQRNLVFLDLSYNNLNRFNWDIFLPYLIKLEELYVDGNNLTEIEGSGHIISNFPLLRVIGISNNNFNCTYLSSFFRLIASGKIRTSNVDAMEQSHDVNVTHINGVACSSSQNFNNSINKPISHMQNNKIQFEILKAKMEYFYHNDMVAMEKINTLQTLLVLQEQQQKHLLDTINHWKYLFGVIAICGFIFIAIKFTRVLNKTRQLNAEHNLHTSNGFPSSTTMNTGISF